MRDVFGKVAVVTGAASGIGRGMAETFAAAGMKVVLSDIVPNALEATTRKLRASGADVYSVVCDVSKPEEVDELARQALRIYGAVDVLCNNAGVGVRPGPSWLNSLDDWRWIVGINLMGVVHGLRSFLPIMIDQGSEAHIVNTASTSGLIADDNTLYGMTKFGVVALSEGVYWELHRGRFKPKISVLCPGCVDTSILKSQRNGSNEAATDSQARLGAVSAAVHEWYSERLKDGLNPREVGDQVLAAIREERFYILTHADEYRLHIERRMTDLLCGCNPTYVPPPGFSSLMEKLSAMTAEGNLSGLI